MFLIAQTLPSADSLTFLEQVSLGRVLAAGLVLAVAWFTIYWIARALTFLGVRVPRARFLFKRVEPVARIAIWFVAIFLVIGLLAPSTETFLAGVGSMAIAIGLGAQDLIKNVIGGVIVLTDRPFQLGDRVKIADAYGEIDHIGLRSTKLTTPDDTRVTIPNSVILTTLIHNANSGVPDCQVVTDVYLPIDVDPDEALRIGREAAYSSAYRAPNRPVAVLLADELTHRPYTRLRIKVYVHDHRFEPHLSSDITTIVKREFRRRGMWPVGGPADVRADSLPS